MFDSSEQADEAFLDSSATVALNPRESILRRLGFAAVFSRF
jgi:hypothetical protein